MGGLQTYFGGNCAGIIRNFMFSLGTHYDTQLGTRNRLSRVGSNHQFKGCSGPQDPKISFPFCLLLSLNLASLPMGRWLGLGWRASEWVGGLFRILKQHSDREAGA